MASTVTLASLRSQARQRADMVNSTFILDDEIDQYINSSIRELYDILTQKFGDEYYLTSTTLNLVSGTDRYSLPSDFYKLAGLDYPNGSGKYLPLRKFNFQERNRFDDHFSARPAGINLRYRLQGNYLLFRPTPTNTASLILWYIPAFQQLSADSDTFDGINGWEEYVVIDVAIKCLIKEESSTTQLEQALAKIKRRIEEAAENRDSAYPDKVSDVRNDVEVDIL